MSVIIYQDHIEILEGENAELREEVLELRRRIKYYQSVIKDYEED